MKSTEVLSVLPLFRAAAMAAACSYAAAAAAQAPPAETFEIRLNRSAPVGSRVRLTVEGARHQTVRATTAGQTVADRVEDLRVHFRAVARVVAPAPGGRVRHSEYVIERFESVDEHGSHVLARRGQVLSVIRGTRRSELVATLDGLPLQPTTRVALGLVVSLSNGGGSDDEVFGTTARRAVGDSWPMNAELGQRDLAQSLGGVTSLTGQTRLERRVTVRRVPCLELVTTLNGAITSLPDLPPGSTIRAGTLRMSMRETLPVATELPSVSSAMDATMDGVVDIPASVGRAAGQVEVHHRETRTESAEALGG